jgi:hypothetical protein
LKIELSPTKTVLGRIDCGLDFLGFNHKMLQNGKITVKQRQQAKQRMKHKIKIIKKYYTEKIVDKEFVKIRENAYLNHLKFAAGKKWVAREMKKILDIHKNP